MQIQDDSDFIPIRAEGFTSGSKSAFDVFVKIESGKYLKLLIAGDQFSPERLENYLKKGVKHFYIRKEVQAEYLSYCKKLSSAVLKSDKLSSEVKIGQTLNQGDELMSILSAQGVHAENLAYAKQFISDVKELVSQMRPDKGNFINRFLEDISAYEHGVSTSMLTGILSYVVEIRMEKPVHIVGVASLFHDIGLSQLPPEARNENENELSSEMRQLYRTHPTIGADMVRDSLDPAAVQAIEQHHMRHLGFGFPERSNQNHPMGKIAEIIGICDDFNLYIQRAKLDPTLEILPEMEKSIFPGFSRQIVYAFRTAFFPKFI